MKNTAGYDSDHFAKVPLSRTLPRYILLFACVLIFFTFGLLERKFFNITNIMDILRTASIIGLLSISAMMVLPTGEVNFSIGAQATFAAAVYGRLMALGSIHWAVCFLITVACMSLIGALTAYIVVKLRVRAFICTMALSTIMYGVVKFFTNNTYFFSSNWSADFIMLGQTRLGGVIPMPLVVFAAIALLVFGFTEHTRTGRHLHATGANITAARQVGIDVEKMKFLAYILCSVFIAVAGILQASISNSVSPDLGREYQMPAIASAMLGATFWKIGKFNVPGTVVAAILMTTIQNGVITAGGAYYIKDIIQGVLLVFAVGCIAVIREEGLPKVSFAA